MRVILDTDVVVSGLRSPSGASRLVLLAIREGAVTLLASVAIMLEYEAFLKRPANLAAAGASTTGVGVFLDGLASVAEPVAHGFVRPFPGADRWRTAAPGRHGTVGLVKWAAHVHP